MHGPRQVEKREHDDAKWIALIVKKFYIKKEEHSR